MHVLFHMYIYKLSFISIHSLASGLCFGPWLSWLTVLDWSFCLLHACRELPFTWKALLSTHRWNHSCVHILPSPYHLFPDLLNTFLLSSTHQIQSSSALSHLFHFLIFPISFSLTNKFLRDLALSFHSLINSQPKVDTQLKQSELILQFSAYIPESYWHTSIFLQKKKKCCFWFYFSS